jgi:hypothetical protein
VKNLPKNISEGFPFTDILSCQAFETSTHLFLTVFVVFFAVVVMMVVIGIGILWVVRTAILIWEVLVSNKEGIAVVKPAANKDAVAIVVSTINANAGYRVALVDRGKQVVVAAGEAYTATVAVITVNAVPTAHHRGRRRLGCCRRLCMC